MTEDEMVGWHHWLDGHEFEQALGVSDGQGSLACCGSWGHRVRHYWATKLNWPSMNEITPHIFFYVLLLLLDIVCKVHPWCCVLLYLTYFHGHMLLCYMKSYLSITFICVCMLSHFSHVWLLVTLWTVACQTPVSMGFSRKKYWSGLPCPSPGTLPIPGIKPTSLLSPSLASRFFTTSTTWEAITCI